MKPIIDKEYYNEQYFNKNPIYFDISKSKFQQYRIKKVMEIYTPSSSEMVLDAGIGWGTFTFYIAKFCRTVVGIDYSFTSLQLCKQHLIDVPEKNILMACTDVQEVPFQAECFDTIISADLIEHLYPTQFENFLKECARLLKKKGKLVLWTPCDSHWIEKMKKNRLFLKPDESHVDYKSLHKIKTALQYHGFSVVKAYNTESHLPVIRIIEKAFLSNCPLFRRRIAVLGEKI
jgi:cyclopropane fatty-acyl-phospholipid synthase-like methyltransferase